MESQFAYSGEMQFILAIISFCSTFIFMYLIADLIMWVYNGQASRAQKLLFAFITGTVMQSSWVYAIYFIGGMLSFSKTTYLLVTTPNPIFALLYCYIGIKVLQLPKIRSIKIMANFYLFYIFSRGIYRLIGSIFFVQRGPAYNYLLDGAQQCTCIVITFAIYFIARYLLKKGKKQLRLVDNLFVYFPNELTSYFIKTTLGWLSFILIPLFVSETITANLLIVLFILMLLIVNILLDYNQALEVNMSNSEAHIYALSSGMEQFSGVKHDFFNILQTYGGYLEVGDLEGLRDYHFSLLHTTSNAGKSIELGKRFNENPGLASLLISKLEYAEKNNVLLKINLQSEIQDFYIDNMDFCRILVCLLDNAIEAAAQSERKVVLLTIEDKPRDSKLIVVSNSTAGAADTSQILAHGMTSKDGHSGVGLTNVRKIVEKYGNCTFKLSAYNDEFITYLEVRKNML